MKFFLPAANSDEQANRVYTAIVKHNGAEMMSRKIFSIHWIHNGKPYYAEIGKPVDSYFGGEVVVAIVENEQLYFICTENRGMIRGQGILVGKGIGIDTGPFVTLFD